VLPPPGVLPPQPTEQTVSVTSGHRYTETVSQAASVSDADFAAWTATLDAQIPESSYTVVSEVPNQGGVVQVVYDYAGDTKSFSLAMPAGIALTLLDQGVTPAQPQPPPQPVGPQPPTAPFPSGWMPFPDPIPTEVVTQAQALLSSLAIGASKMISMPTPASLASVYSAPVLWVTYQGQSGAPPYTKNVVAWVVTGTLPAPAPSPQPAPQPVVVNPVGPPANGNGGNGGNVPANGGNAPAGPGDQGDGNATPAAGNGGGDQNAPAVSPDDGSGDAIVGAGGLRGWVKRSARLVETTTYDRRGAARGARR